MFLLSFILLGKVNLSLAQCPNVGVNPNITAFNGCAPFTFSYSAVYPSSGPSPIPTNITYEVFADWGDGITSITPATIGVNASGTPSILATPSHIYPHFSDPTLGECVYTVKTTLLANGVKCDDVNYDFSVRVWDNDGYRGGRIGIAPAPVYLCVGESRDITFTDVSEWNCTGNVGTKNLGFRTIQWVYGEIPPSGRQIPGITISSIDGDGKETVVNMNGNVLNGLHYQYENDLLAPDGSGKSWVIHVPATDNAAAWSEFNIKLKNWNFCNPYNPLSEEGKNAPVYNNAQIIILPIPNPIYNSIDPFCEGDQPIDLDFYRDPSSNFLVNTLLSRSFSGPGIEYDSANEKWFFNPAVAGAGSHDIFYTETNKGGCSNEPLKITIVVNPGPIAKMMINDKDVTNSTELNLCAAAEVKFENTSIGAKSVSWIITDGTNELPPRIDNSFTYTFINTTGNVKLVALGDNVNCPDEINIPITINPPVVAAFNVDKTEGCSPLTINLRNETQDRTKYSYLWEITDVTLPNPGLTHQSGIVLENNSSIDKVFPILLRITEKATKCTDEEIKNVTVFAPPTAGEDQIICAGVLTTAFQATTSGGTGTWTFLEGPGNATFENTNPTSPLTVDFPGTYKFKWDVIGSCGGTDEVTINFVPQPAPNAGADVPALCDLNYVLRASPPTGTGLWTKISGPGNAVFQNTAANITRVTVDMGGDYIFRWTDDPGFGCPPAYDDVAVSFSNPPVTPSFTFSADGKCSGLTVTFTNTSPAGASNFEWDFGDGADKLVTEERTVTHTYVNATSMPIDFAVQLKAGLHDACSRVSSKIVTVDPEFSAGYPVTYDGCGPLTRKFENAYPWNFSVRWEDENGNLLSTDMQPELTFTAVNGQETTYKVYLVGESANGCTDRVENTVIVRVPPVAAFTTRSTNDCAPKLVSFTNTSSLDATSFQWNFGDGSEISISPNPTHTFVETTGAQASFNVVLTARNRYGCASTATTTIDVLPTPQADFTVTPQVQTFPNRTVQVSNLTPPGNWSYSWNFGDNSPVETGNITQHTYSSPGNYTITLTAAGTSCSTSRSNGITIYPGAALADFEPDTTGCAPLTVKFKNNSVNGFRYLWSFGNGNHSTDFEPSNIYYNEGTYTVRLETYNHQGEMSSAERTIVVHPKPNAFFRPLPDRVRLPGQSVTFANFSTHADNLLWDFGDGTTSDKMEPVHTYQQTGFYDIQLIVSSLENCADTFLLEKGVEVYSEGALNVPNAFMPSKDGPSGGIYTPGDPHNHVFYPTVVAGDLEKYELQIYNRWGNLLFQSNEPELGWDGYYNDQLCPQDVYVWKIKCRFLNGTEITKTGDVTLIR